MRQLNTAVRTHQTQQLTVSNIKSDYCWRVVHNCWPHLLTPSIPHEVVQQSLILI